MLSPYLDHVEHELRSAVRRQAHLPWWARLRARHPRALIVAIAALVVAGPALAAVSLLQRGPSVGPTVQPTPTAFNGVAIKSSIRLLPLRAHDPVGGPPWGMRTVRTTRGLVCMQVGRVAFGTVGAIGQDGAFRNDARFHPFSADYEAGAPCPVPDANGNAFLNVGQFGVPASGLTGPRESFCSPPRSIPARLPIQARRRLEQHLRASPGPVCSTRDLRELYYGLLGPDAVSITYQTSTGQQLTTPTVGPDGAYLIVLPDRPSINNGGLTYDTALLYDGVVRAIHYRDGHTCQLQLRRLSRRAPWDTCQPVGYATPSGAEPTPQQVAGPITVHVDLANTYCIKQQLVEPCPRTVPPGFHRISGGPPSALVTISFISRVAVTNGHSYYYISISRPPHPNPRYGQLACAGGGDFGQTNFDYRAGQRVTQHFFENLSCQGTAHGTVTLVTTTGPTAPAPMPAAPGQSAGRDVGHFSFTIP